MNRTQVLDDSSTTGGRTEDNQELAGQSNEPDAASKHKKRDEAATEIPMDQKDPHEYICMARPYYDLEAENDDKDEDSQLDEDELRERCNAEAKGFKHDQPASELPEHRWILMRKSWITLCDALRETSYRNPDNFDMYIYNDFEGYGLMEMVENCLVAYYKEFKRKRKNLKDMWIFHAAFAHWSKMSQLAPLGMIDDGERLAETIELAGRAFLSMLNALDRAGQLKPDSEFKDLGLVMGLFATIAGYFEDSYDEDELDWRHHILQYAKDKEIDLGTAFEAKQLAEEFEDEHREEWPAPAVDRWSFSRKFKKHEKHYESLGGTNYDITKMSRTERARFAFDKRDPLAGISDKDLKEGNLMFG